MKRFYEFNGIARFVFLGLAGFMLVWNIFAFFLVETEHQFDIGMFAMFALLVLGRICDIWSAPNGSGYSTERIDNDSERK